jgi:hypothetical protein
MKSLGLRRRGLVILVLWCVALGDGMHCFVVRGFHGLWLVLQAPRLSDIERSNRARW